MIVIVRVQAAARCLSQLITPPAGFPDMHNRGRFKFGWDAEKRRGIMTSRYLHITRPGKEKEALDRAARAIELQFDYYGPFGFGAVVARLDEPMFDLNKK
jgi:hypothetical protein